MILITGASGFVGSAVLRKLIERGHEVRALVRPSSERRNLEGLPVHIVEGDLMAPETLKPAVEGCKGVFHVAADYRLWAPDPSGMFAANVDGPDSSLYGRGGWTWYTGSSAWVYRVLMESIMGVRPTWDGLLIDPCIPSHWPGFKMTRRYRGNVYHIEVTRPDGAGLEVHSVTLDGEPIDGAVIPPPEP
ncbi:MAG: NAD-dependent epimerase/dehydratase family protein, partial [Proteobacteria bacterium]|nr:NAD-dependent epimerase/dehydratase family protein [Pseudomonadota bacterium]